jgi:hypothetical protein
LSIGYFVNNQKSEGYEALANADILMSAAGNFDGWLDIYSLARWLESDRANHALMIRLKNLPTNSDAGILFRGLLYEN